MSLGRTMCEAGRIGRYLLRAVVLRLFGKTPVRRHTPIDP